MGKRLARNPQGGMRFANKEKLGRDPTGLGLTAVSQPYRAGSDGGDSSIRQSGPWSQLSAGHPPGSNALDWFTRKVPSPRSTGMHPEKSGDCAKRRHPDPSAHRGP